MLVELSAIEILRSASMPRKIRPEMIFGRHLSLRVQEFVANSGNSAIGRYRLDLSERRET